MGKGKAQKSKKIKAVNYDSDSSSDCSSDSSIGIKMDLWNSKPITACVKPNTCHKIKDPCIIIENCNPISADICLQKHLLTVSRIPLPSIVSTYFLDGSLPTTTLFSQLILTYEVVIINKSNNKISNISLFDSLAGITFGTVSAPYSSTVEVVKCPGNISLYDIDDIAARNGLLNNPDGSYLPPNSVTKIVLKLVIGANPGSICEVRYVQNSISLEGSLETSSVKDKTITITRKPIKPISEISNIWQTDTDLPFLFIGIPLI